MIQPGKIWKHHVSWVVAISTAIVLAQHCNYAQISFCLQVPKSLWKLQQQTKAPTSDCSKVRAQLHVWYHHMLSSNDQKHLQ